MRIRLEDDSGFILLEDGSYWLQEHVETVKTLLRFIYRKVYRIALLRKTSIHIVTTIYPDLPINAQATETMQRTATITRVMNVTVTL